MVSVVKEKQSECETWNVSMMHDAKIIEIIKSDLNAVLDASVATS